MEVAMFQPHQAADLSGFVYVVLDVEARMEEGTSETINSG